MAIGFSRQLRLVGGTHLHGRIALDDVRRRDQSFGGWDVSGKPADILIAIFALHLHTDSNCTICARGTITPAWDIFTPGDNAVRQREEKKMTKPR